MKNIKILWNEIIDNSLIGAAFVFLSISLFVSFISPQIALAFWSGGIVFAIFALLLENFRANREVSDSEKDMLKEAAIQPSVEVNDHRVDA